MHLHMQHIDTCGNLVWKDFKIKKEAGRVSFKAVQIDFRAQVSKNYLEIHLFWAGKGTCCIPTEGTYGPSISAISAIPGYTFYFIPTVGTNSTSGKKSKTGLILGIVVPIGVIPKLSINFLVYSQTLILTVLAELLGMDVRPYTISYVELKAATEDFNPTNKLGQGDFGTVFKVAAVSFYHHIFALIKTMENTNPAVLDYLLRTAIYWSIPWKTSLFLNWTIRFDICLGVARALVYLHVESRLCIVHRNVKASNILLDSHAAWRGVAVGMSGCTKELLVLLIPR
ncbi:hypothetical protein RHSIM_RhsimUnG0155400 [Rhododendron simsii]|uniref:non-specific serine/threonine protein kinase n=1 Tax=Rhododendron simsii TaxID=118357 RepID=A0A834L4J3_RHOSS|nr:hypothetical protein RHSIM_RhsimUnG0155400 [Rhododendron simsii]